MAEAEVTAKEHKDSKKRRHEDGVHEKSEKKRKKHKKAVSEEQEVENPTPDDTPTVAAPDAIVPDESSPKKHKKKSKKKDRHKERLQEQHQDVDIPAETNEDSSIIEPREPEPESTTPKKEKSKKKKKVREDENSINLVDEAPKSASSSRDVLDEADTTQPEKKKKKKKDKTKSESKNKDGNNETEVDQRNDASRSLNLETANSEDILQAFQQLDLARLHGALGGLDVQTLGLDTTPDENDEHSQPTTTTPDHTKKNNKPSNKRPVADGSEPPRKKRKHVVDLKNLVDPNSGDQHSQLLATKWLSSKELQALADTEGLVYKKGKFSFTESHAAKTAVEQFRTRKGMTEDAMVQFIFAKHQQEHKQFWTDVALAVPGRPLQAVYHHVKLSYNPLGKQGKWIPAEDAALRRAVADLGTSWTKVSQQIGRTAQDCKDRWRNHLSLTNQQFGKWTQEEIDELTNIVRSLTTEKGKDLDSEILWGAVSLKMEGRRSREQCRDKWRDLKLKMDNENVRRWSKNNTYVLLQRMAALSVNDESEIVWNDLIYGQLDSWTAHSLRNVWKRAESSVPDYENKAFKDVLTSLLEQYKKYETPKPAKKNLKFPQAPEPKSAEVIEDSADEESSESDS